MASHVSQCMAKASMCDTWQAMCVTHGMPCVTMHGFFKAYIYGVSKSVCGEGQKEAVRGSSKEKEEEWEKRKGGKEKRKGGKERRKGGKWRKKERRKEKKKGEEERKKKEEKEGVLHSEQTRTTKNPELHYRR